MIEIIPAVMPTSTTDLQTKLAQVAGHMSVAQIDVMDGKFVKNVSWPYTEDEEYFEGILHEDAGLPYWDQFDFEVDLMIVRPEEVINDWITAGVRRIVIHQESTSNLEKILTDFRTRFTKNEQPDIFDCEIGVAQNIDTPVEQLFHYIEQIDFVQFMGIAVIGEQGNPFDERVLDKIKTLRERVPSIIISVDGGVSLDSAPALVAAGVNRLVVGSAIFKSEDIGATIKEFKHLGNKR
jgi:ribulose-phosphate 3-epimerase